MASHSAHRLITAHDEPSIREDATTRSLSERVAALEARMIAGMARYGATVTRFALGIVFLWFGALKFAPGCSPAASLATRTIERISFGCLTPHISLPLLATWECLIGLGFLSGRYLRATLLLLFTHLSGTLIPLVLFPRETFRVFPYDPTLEGQYILKNIVLIAAGIMVGATLRSGRTSGETPARSAA